MRHLLLVAGAAALLSASPALADPKGKAKGQFKAKPNAARVIGDMNRNGIDDRVEVMGNRYGGAVCPPGLAKKDPVCMPPGQAKRLFQEGQRLPSNYRHYTPYGSIPVDIRDRYDLDDDHRYIYRDNRVYVVDPRTSLVTRIIDAIL